MTDTLEHLEPRKRGRPVGGAAPLAIPSRDDLFYTAGLFDGEGCISIVVATNNKSRTKCHRLFVSISMTDERIVTWLTERYGGGVYRHHKSKRDPRNADSYTWRLFDATAETFLRTVGPYLKVKSPNVEVAYKLRATKGKGRPKKGTEAVLFAEREQIRSEMTALNQTGQEGAEYRASFSRPSPELGPSWLTPSRSGNI